MGEQVLGSEVQCDLAREGRMLKVTDQKKLREKIQRERLATSLETADVSGENWADADMFLAKRTVS